MPFTFSRQLKEDNFDSAKKRSYSIIRINYEWILKCWLHCDDMRPEFLEICRQSTTGDILISGTFKLMKGQNCLLQRKFLQLIEDGSTTTLLDLKHSHLFPSCSGSNIYSNHIFFIDGTLTIPANLAKYKHAKGDNFESLVELSSDFERLIDPKATFFADVNLKCGSVSFSAHKTILSVRSSVFAAMFTTEMKEKRENKVEISDISPNVLKIMLAYIYTGKTGKLSVQSAGELLFAADKYQLQELKRVCSDYLKNCLSVENVLETLALGYLHDNDLRVFAMDYICNACGEFEVLEKTVTWKNFREKRPSLAMDVLTLVIKSKDEKLRFFKN